MRVNIYKLYFLSFYFSSQLNKKVFYASTFLSSQTKTHEEKLNFFYLPLF